MPSVEGMPSSTNFDSTKQTKELFKDIQTTLIHSISRTVNMLAQMSQIMMRDRGLVPAHSNHEQSSMNSASSRLPLRENLQMLGLINDQPASVLTMERDA